MMTQMINEIQEHMGCSIAAEEPGTFANVSKQELLAFFRLLFLCEIRSHMNLPMEPALLSRKGGCWFLGIKISMIHCLVIDHIFSVLSRDMDWFFSKSNASSYKAALEQLSIVLLSSI